MDPVLLGKINQGIARIQSLWSEDVTIGSAPYKALIGQQSIENTFTPEGMREVLRMRLSIAGTDMPAAPAIGALVVARGLHWRLVGIDPTQTTYELTVESPTK